MAQSTINLLSKDDVSASTLGRVSVWALSVGRWIVVITELIVIAAFLSRFSLDRQIADLTDEIVQKSAIVQGYAPFEEKFKQTQSRLNLVNQALNSQNDDNQILSEIGKALPNDVYLSKVSIQRNELTIQGIALTEPGMAGMREQLQSSEFFSQVSLARIDIEKGFEEGIKFEIKAKIAT